MSEEFGGTSGDPTKVPNNGFNSNDGDQPSVSNNAGITNEDLIELRKRDENAQAHIPRLEGENEDLRTRMADLESKLASNSVLEEVMAKLDGKDGDQTPGTAVDTDTLVQNVEARLEKKAQDKIQEQNWNTMVGKLTEQYGSWENADKEITARCVELNMDTQEATRLARTAPAAFDSIFRAKEGQPPQQSFASMSNTQTPVTSAIKDETQLAERRAYYTEMRRKNPNKWQKLETQKVMWQELYGVEL